MSNEHNTSISSEAIKVRELQRFVFTDCLSVRSLLLDGEPWFIAKDVCEALDISNTSDALRALDEDERRLVLKSNVGNPDINFPNRGLAAINESGLYALILRSNKESARAFRKWLTSVVLPSIRKTGGYIVDSEYLTDSDKAHLNAQIATFAAATAKKMIDHRENKEARYKALKGRRSKPKRKPLRSLSNLSSNQLKIHHCGLTKLSKGQHLSDQEWDVLNLTKEGRTALRAAGLFVKKSSL